MEHLLAKTKLNLLISAMLLSMAAGCGGGGSSSAAPGASPTSTAAPTTTTTTISTTTTTTHSIPSGQIILPASVPQPVVAGTDIVGINLQNTTNAALAAHVFTFGQIFKQGAVLPTDTLVAHINGTAYQVQLDTLATWPADGSVKLGAITLITPVLSAGSTVGVLLSKTTSSITTPVDLKTISASTTLNVSLAFTSGQYSGTRSIDLAAALHTALLNGSASYWLQGPLATQARVDVPIAGGPLHITADVTAYSDNSITADVQFNYDLVTILPTTGTPQSPLPALQYTATINLQGTPTNRTVSQFQYTDWHAVVNSTGAPVLNVSSSAGPAINVQHDLAYLEHSGAILPYDRMTGVSDNTLQGLSTIIAGTSTYPPPIGVFGQPLASNGVTAYMPSTGGRADIGYTTMYNTVWLMTGDSRAATVGLAQGDTAGAVPWNYKLANNDHSGHWLTPGDYPNIWVDGRGGQQSGTNTIANLADGSVWSPDPAHQPNLAYIPYIMTGQRWYLDRLNAQAAFDEVATTPFSSGQYQAAGRYAGQLLTAIVPSLANTADIVIAPGNQLRAAAWDMREIQEAAFVGKPGTFEQGFFAQAVIDNWNYFLAMKPALTAQQGQAAGWMPNTYGSTYPQVIMAPWQQDYFTGIAALGATMGYTGALEYINWQKSGWLSGRFDANSGMTPYDGADYNLAMSDPSGTLLTSWAAIEAATVLYCSVPAHGCSTSNGSSFPTGSAYPQWARGALGAALTLYPTDNNLSRALQFVQLHGTYVDQTSLQNDPTFNVVPLQ